MLNWSTFYLHMLSDTLFKSKGLTDLAEEGKFVWGSDYSEPDYKNWDEDEPNGLDCVELYRSSDFRWHAYGCGNREHAVCQKDP